jgi:hypothetical protein
MTMWSFHRRVISLQERVMESGLYRSIEFELPARRLTVIPAQAGRSAQRGERPKDGPEGVSEANHPC